MYGQKSYIYTVELSQRATQVIPDLEAKNPAWRPGQPLVYVGIHTESPLKLFAGGDFSESRHSLVRKFGKRLVTDYYRTKKYRRAVLRTEEEFILQLRGKGCGVVTRSHTRDSHVYVVELDPEAAAEASESGDEAPGAANELPPVYVGMTSKTPEERFKQHKAGGRMANETVEEFGIRLRPDLYEGLNPLTGHEALRTERSLKCRLERAGFHAEGGT